MIPMTALRITFPLSFRRVVVVEVKPVLDALIRRRIIDIEVDLVPNLNLFLQQWRDCPRECPGHDLHTTAQPGSLGSLQAIDLNVIMVTLGLLGRVPMRGGSVIVLIQSSKLTVAKIDSEKAGLPAYKFRRAEA
jgi:hypothetical protein